MSYPRLIRPSPLRKGDTIALLSPSSRYNETYTPSLRRCAAHLQSLGFEITEIYTSHVEFDKLSYKERISKRTEEVHKAFRDPR